MDFNLTDKRQIYYSLAAIGCIVIGAFIYIFWRPDSLLMFYWFKAVSLNKWILYLRGHIKNPSNTFAKTVIFSGPFALWVLSYLFCMKVIWYKSQSRLRYVWFISIPLLSVLIEFFQQFPFIPGTFDIIDIYAIIIVLVLFGGLSLIPEYIMKR